MLALLRAAAVPSHAQRAARACLPHASTLPFSASPSKKMKGSRAPGGLLPGRRASPSSHGGSQSAPVGKSSMYREDEPSISPNAIISQRYKSPHAVTPQQRQASPERVRGSSSAVHSEPDCEARTFDICKTESLGPVKLKVSLLEANREKRKELERSKNCQNQYLGPGMVLLKNYIGHNDQVRIIQRCQEFGTGTGGFYRPGYRDGAKLHLHMMCLGMNWDPESRLYEKQRQFDGAEPPKIPEEFRKLVDRAIQASHDFLMQKIDGINVEDEIPKMLPDICIVNFYSNTGKLGLHQDRDESKDSLHKGLPVVSFSLGDSAVFLYGTERDVDRASKVVLESGDVLIFGGRSRLIFHGVSTILPNTAPKGLIEETKLRPGRLNLTFRQYK